MDLTTNYFNNTVSGAQMLTTYVEHFVVLVAG